MNTGDNENATGAVVFYDEPTTVAERDNARLAFLLRSVMEAHEQGEVEAILLRIFGNRPYHLLPGDEGDTELRGLTDRLSVSVGLLCRMWFAYLKGLDEIGDGRHFQRNAWMDCPTIVRRQREEIMRYASQMPGQVQALLFSRPRNSEIGSVEECAKLVAELQRRIDHLASDLRSIPSDTGGRIAALKHGRSFDALTPAWRRNLLAYALTKSGEEPASGKVRSLFVQEDQRLENPQDRAKIAGSVHTSLSRVKKWLREVENNAPIKRTQGGPNIPTRSDTPKEYTGDFHSSLSSQLSSKDHWDWIEGA